MGEIGRRLCLSSSSGDRFLISSAAQAIFTTARSPRSVLSHPQDFASTVIYAVSLGGDTDTIASMAGAISGVYLGIEALPLLRLEAGTAPLAMGDAGGETKVWFI